MSERIFKVISDLEEVKKSNNAYVAGCLDMWAAMLESDPEMIKAVIKSMDEMAALLRKNAGVVMDNAD